MQQGNNGYEQNTASRRPVDDGQSIVMKPVGYGRPASQQESFGYSRIPAGQPVNPGSVPMQPVNPASVPMRPVNPASVPMQPVNPASVPMQPVNQDAQGYPAGGERIQPQDWPEARTDMDDHFGMTGYDPSLAAVRSEKLVTHDDPFFQPLTSGEGVGQYRRQPEEKPKREPMDPVKRKLISWISAVLVLVGLALGFWLIFQVNTILVVGNTTVPSETVIALSGIKPGTSMFAVDEQRARDGIGSNRYLIFEGMEKNLPNQVIIRVRERTAAAMMNYCGINYTIDGKGMVLEESQDVHYSGALMVISGVDVASQNGCAVGRQLNTRNPLQLSVIREVITELKVIRMEGEITHFTVSDLSSLLMETREGYSVRLGDYTNLHAKLKSLKAVKEELNRRQTGLGTIDVSNPEHPSFLPEENE